MKIIPYANKINYIVSQTQTMKSDKCGFIGLSVCGQNEEKFVQK
jgi:hypothetical protein